MCFSVVDPSKKAPPPQPPAQELSYQKPPARKAGGFVACSAERDRPGASPKGALASSITNSRIPPLTALSRAGTKFWRLRAQGKEPMKKFALAIALVVTSLSLAGCFVGKGKAPPPVVTKG